MVKLLTEIIRFEWDINELNSFEKQVKIINSN